jgi:hypothetical protein
VIDDESGDCKPCQADDVFKDGDIELSFGDAPCLVLVSSLEALPLFPVSNTRSL